MTGPAWPGHECYPGGPQHHSTPGPYCAPARCYCPGAPGSATRRGLRTTVDGEPLFLRPATVTTRTGTTIRVPQVRGHRPPPPSVSHSHADLTAQAMEARELDGPGQARTTDPDTAHAAAQAYPLRKGSHRTLLLLAFAEAGDRGATDERAAFVAGLSPRSEYATRCSELKRAGLVVDTTETRPGSSGAARVVRRITPAGLLAAEGLR